MLYTGRVASTISVMKLSADTSLLSTIVAELCALSADAQRLLLPLALMTPAVRAGAMNAMRTSWAKLST